MNPTGTVVTEDEYCADTKEAHGTGSLTDFWSETNHGLHIGSLDLPILILITFPSMLVRQNASFIRSHLQIRRGSSAYRFSKVHIVRNALQRGSSIALNSRGSVLSFGKNSHYHSKFLSRVATSAHSASGISRMSCMRFTCHSLKSGWWRAYQMTHLATQSIYFSRWMKAMCSVLSTWNCSYTCRPINMASSV